MQTPPQKITLITGATSGIGLAASKGLVGEGHLVIGVGRSEEKVDAAQQSILTKHPDADIHYLLADLSSQTQIHKLAKEVRAYLNTRNLDHIDVLVNNAGAVSSWFTLTEDGYELQFAVNHLAPFLLTHELLPLLEKSEQARILTTSSASHRNTRIHWKDVMLRKHYSTLGAYKQSKLANVLFTYELNRRLGPDSPVTAFAIDPGLVNTNIGTKGTNGFVNWFWKKRSSKGTCPEIAAETIVYLGCRREIPYSNAYYWKECHPISPSRYAQKEEPAARLWELSEKLSGIRFI
jgi:NAD(P)-dependent dehydrogenase (short-subunit alcohol dehydrogenase family)